MTGSFPMPHWSTILAAFLEPSVLRTRATATAFRVRADGNFLVVTTGAGNDRVIPGAEVTRCWPLAERNAPRVEWKRHTENSSYIESIYDFLRESTSPAEEIDDALETSLARQRLQDQDALIARLRARLADLEDQRDRIAKLEERLREMSAEVVQADATRRARGVNIEEVAKARLLAAALRRDLDAIRRASAETDRQLSSAKREVSALELKLSAAQSTVALTQKALESAKEELARRDTSALVEMSVAFNLGSRSFASSHRLERVAAEAMQRAARLIDSDPDNAISSCRRVLEACVREIWRMKRSGPEPPSFTLVLDDLHRDPVFPMTDWHLSKQLWTRASGYVHQGGAKPEAALWIWLGTQQIAELVPVTRPAAPSQQSPLSTSTSSNPDGKPKEQVDDG